jgi:hypothetical protein
METLVSAKTPSMRLCALRELFAMQWTWSTLEYLAMRFARFDHLVTMQVKALLYFTPFALILNLSGPRGVVKLNPSSGGYTGPDSHGFCILNNISIGAAYAMNRYREKIKKVAIVDFGILKPFYDLMLFDLLLLQMFIMETALKRL